MATQRGTHRSTRLLVTLAILAVFLMVGGGLLGTTFASFNARTVNHSNEFMSGTMYMWNEASPIVGGANCTGDETVTDCAVVLHTQNMKPTDTSSGTVKITYKGSLATGSFGLYSHGYVSGQVGPGPTCRAAHPGDKLNMTITQSGNPTPIYTGTFHDFATNHTSAANMLSLTGSAGAGKWAQDDSYTFTISVTYDASADNDYQNCYSSLDLDWYAAQ